MVAKFFTTLVLVFTLIFQNISATPVKRADDVQLKAVLIADIHTDADFTRDRCNSLRRIFSAIGNTQGDADTLVMAGDMTNSGDRMEYQNLGTFLDLYCRIGDRMPEMGNHDSWNHSDDPSYENAKKYFLSFCSRNGIKTDTVYYSKCVNGFKFIVMGVEDCDFKNPYHSDAQLDWLEKELNDAVSQNRPVFVICHKPVESLGAAAARTESILLNAAQNAGAPVVYVSGHNHEIGENTYSRPAENLIYLNLPSVLYTEDGGLGFNAVVKEGELTLTGMNYLTNETLEGYEYSFEY